MTDNDWIDGEVIHINLKKDVISNILWRTKDMRQIRVGDMDDKHIRNSALFLMNLGFSKCIASEAVKIAWLRIFAIEWERRIAARANGMKKWYSGNNKDSLDRLLSR